MSDYMAGPLARSIYRSLIIINPDIWSVTFKIKTTHPKVCICRVMGTLFIFWQQLYCARPSAGVVEAGKNIHVTGGFSISRFLSDVVQLLSHKLYSRKHTACGRATSEQKMQAQNRSWTHRHNSQFPDEQSCTWPSFFFDPCLQSISYLLVRRSKRNQDNQIAWARRGVYPSRGADKRGHCWICSRNNSIHARRSVYSICRTAQI